MQALWEELEGGKALPVEPTIMALIPGGRGILNLGDIVHVYVKDHFR